MRRQLLWSVAALHIVLLIIAISVWFSLRRQFDGKGVWLTWVQHESPWCERDRAEDLAREPANSLSDFAYLFVALFISCCGAWDLISSSTTREPRNPILQYPVLSFSYAFINLVHFLGTFWNHSCRCLHGHILDCTGMYCVVAWMGAYAYWQRTSRAKSGSPYSVQEFVVVSVGMLAVFYVYEYFFWSDIVRDVTMVSIVVATLYNAHSLHTLAPTEWHVWLPRTAFGTGVIAYIAWILDTTHTVCWPDSMFQLHAIWHYITALDIILVYLCLRSERYSSLRQTFAIDVSPQCN